jgi:hypothetical protein
MAKIPSGRTTLPDPLRFHPGPIFDPVPWQLVDKLDAKALKNLTQIRLQHQRDTSALQAKALDKALKVISGK